MLPVLKTPKCYVGGAFVRSESGRVYELSDPAGSFLANIPLCTRKDVREAVSSAAKAGPAWAARCSYNRAQILYRLAEMMESRAAELAAAVALTGRDAMLAERETRASIGRVLHFAGWADKYEQVMGTVNPVIGSFFNFTVTEPMGIAGILCPENTPLLALLTLSLPALISGNTVVALASHSQPCAALLLGEILAVSDLPGGVFNLLTGRREDMLPTFATHEHIRALAAVAEGREAVQLQQGAAESVKRVTIHDPATDWFASAHNSPWAISNFTEAKTIWHPVGA